MGTPVSPAQPHVTDADGPATVSRLPVLVGRERETRALLALLAQPANRLITLTGPGGAGKTRLVVSLAAQVGDTFPGGIWLIPLAALTDPDLVVPAIAEALALDVPDPTVPAVATVNQRLAGQRGLVVLDNAEQVIGAASSLASLLAHCPALTVVATSRERFRITGEQVFVVPPLELPASDATGLAEIAASDAVQLFVSRARAVAPTFQLTTTNAPAVAEICRQLDGLPLALELAAARSDVLSPAALLTRLERRLVLLTGGGRDQPERLRTMRSAIQWSHDLLSDADQILFRRLAVFSGGFSLEAAEQVCASRPGDATAPAAGIDTADVLDGIISLVEKSLLRPYDGPNDERRFRMLQTIRDYAAERLAEAGERAMVVTRLTEWVTGLVEQAHTGLREEEQARWLAILDAEAGNVRVALAAVAGDGSGPVDSTTEPVRFEPVLILRLTGFMWRYWALRGRRREGHDWLIRALRTPGVEQAPIGDRARSSLILGNFERAVGNVQGARSAYETALALWEEDGDSEGVADAKTNLALLAILGGEYATARQLLDETLVLRQLRPLPYSIALTLGTMAETAILELDFDRGERLAREAIAIQETIGDHSGLAYARHLLAEIALRSGRLHDARALVEESFRAFNRIDDQPGLSLVHRITGHLAVAEDPPDHPGRAALAYGQALRERIAIADQVGIVECLIDAAWLLSRAISAGVTTPPGTTDEIAAMVATIRDYLQRSMMVPTPFDRPKLTETEAFLTQAGTTNGISPPAIAAPVEAVADRAVELLESLATTPGPHTRSDQPYLAPAERTAGPRASGVTGIAPSRPGPLTTPEAGQPVRLTRRELQVLTLIVAGRLDREIAAELFISHRTVTTHVTSILAKMSVSSRTAAAATAVRLGMV
ncbi:MAG: hypothetical protein AVDCRST_MAG33-1353 [uncultured Thermomicrobiales bacterium]|uniref:HTH luxR-type domain-containing protein n=1 Tax=uncultured Thermomicrobiales bacterium TaxID=1645740 RepID=A0A6J4USI9_9BACT|nr:MAG: hypothetical protein AVDCRST_MAG33-1353 [uncultured Thermomicrobiales bacterium]